MYNGIGLATARGSGTNGYVQKSLAVNRFRDDNVRDRSKDSKGDPLRKADAGILEHERKRKVEVKCMELRMQLEDKGMNDEEIEKEVSQLRTTLSSSNAGYTHDEAKAMRVSDVHARAAAKAKEVDNFAKALGIRSDYVSGQTFDRDLQEKMKQERMEARKAKQEAWQRQKEEREQMMKERERSGFNGGFGRGGGGSRYDARDSGWGRKDQGDGPPRRSESRSRSPPRGPRADARRDERDYDRRRASPPPRNDFRSPSPPPRRRSSRSSPDRRRDDSRSRSISPYSPPPRRRYDSRSPSPPPRRRYDSRTPERSSPRRRYDSRTPERDSGERSRRARSPSYSRSPTPEVRGTSRRHDDYDDPKRGPDTAGPNRSIRRPDVD